MYPKYIASTIRINTDIGIRIYTDAGLGIFTDIGYFYLYGLLR